MSEVTVLIIGCGIAGPVLAILLQRKGYRPIVFEKVSRLGDVGGLLMLMPNGYIVPIIRARWKN
jgi:salicylate hydroxylase